VRIVLEDPRELSKEERLQQRKPIHVVESLDFGIRGLLGPLFDGKTDSEVDQ